MTYWIGCLQKIRLGAIFLAKQLRTTFVNVLGEALWYIDGNEKTFRDRAIPISSQLQCLHGY